MLFRRIALACGLACAVVGYAPGAAAQCPVAAAGACGIELHGEAAPRLSESCASQAWKPHLAFQLPERFADRDENGWHEVVLELDLDPQRGCGCAVVRVHYEGEPDGFTVNIGDSPTNDGFGGDSWTTHFDAELLVQRRELTAFSSELPGNPAEAQRFGLSGLPLTDGILELEICDQIVRLAIEPTGGGTPIRGFFNASRGSDLIAIQETPADQESPAIAPDSRIYASFNRVIHRRSGRPSQNRFGSGVRRVEVSLTP